MRPLISLEEHNKSKLEIFQEFGAGIKNGIACPNCNSELYDVKNITLTSYPPQYPTFCKECGYSGTRY